jgi:hypothetical protein
MAVEHAAHREGRRQAARPGAIEGALAGIGRVFGRVLSVRRLRGRRTRALTQLDERRIMAQQRQRALARVAAAASEACEDWARGIDVDEAMLRLRAELRSAAEFTD